MKDIIISDDIIYIGADDKDIELFENQYNVPNGVAYNSYIIIDKKIAIMDTIDKRRTNQWLENLDKALNGRKPDYLVISHLEPDHAYNINTLMKKYPDIKLVGNSKTFTFLPQFFDIQNLDSKKIEVKEGEILDLGNHKLKFIMAPMVHWPEVMMTYEEKGISKVVLSNLSKEDWSEAIENAFRYGKIVFASSTYNMEIFTPMRNLLLNLKEKNYQNKIVGLIENGTWAPNSAKCMKEILNTMKNIDIIEPVVTIKSKLSEENCLQLYKMAEDLIKK